MDQRLYVFGGFFDIGQNAATHADAYDPAGNEWTQLADAPEAITHAGQATDGHTIYIAGGVT